MVTGVVERLEEIGIGTRDNWTTLIREDDPNIHTNGCSTQVILHENNQFLSGEFCILSAGTPALSITALEIPCYRFNDEIWE